MSRPQVTAGGARAEAWPLATVRGGRVEERWSRTEPAGGGRAEAWYARPPDAAGGERGEVRWARPMATAGGGDSS